MDTTKTLEELLLQWESLYLEGQYVPAEELAADYPDLIPALQTEIDRLLRANEMLDDVTETYPETSGVAHVVTRSATQLEATSSYGKLAFHAKGGRGAIYRAEQAELRRHVAIKFLKRSSLSDPALRTRFLFEAEATSQLDHPGIAPVFASGKTEDGQLFYAMRFVRGGTLESNIDEYYETDWRAAGEGQRRTQFHQLLRHLVSAAKTVAYAHKRSILNLDVKPRNIMIGKYGETLVVDWGEAVPVETERFTHLQTEGPLPVARESASSESSSSDGGGGTLPYMAPERMPRSRAPVTAATDIYSLGVALYRILTGSEAFSGRDQEQLIERIEAGDYRPATQVNPAAPPALAAISRKAMALDPADRYPSALAFADDVERWLDDEPVTAYRETATERLGRWGRRHQGSWITLGVLMVCGIVLLAVMSTFLGTAWDRAEEARKQCLQLSAEATAKLVAHDFESRWRILEFEAADAQLLAALEAVRQSLADGDAITLGQGPQAPLQARLESIYDEWEKSTQAASMLVMDDQGHIVARAPVEDNTSALVGASFRYRDYFHGRGEDLDQEQAATDASLAPITRPYVSIALKSKDNGRLRVQFTVPIRGTGNGILGVLGMAVEIADFDLLDRDPNRLLVLADLRPTRIDNLTRDTLILHHPGMTRPELHSLSDPVLVRHARALIKIHKFRPEERAADAPRPAESWHERYVDPLQGGLWRAALEPVQVRRTKKGDTEPLELIIIAQERVR